MASLVEHLSTYATYHRDKRNIATHFVGIPMIVVGAQAALARIGVGPLNASVAATFAASAYYKRIDPKFGQWMTTVMGATAAIGTSIAQLPLPVWAAASSTLFVGGWAIQFLGHKLEGKKPAFLDDLRSLLIGPLFLVAEAAFALGLERELREQIERIAGPTRWGRVEDGALSAA
ncbi:MAG TPA: Mpo1-like protein [Kofleriaceae bacterium]|nr:Mpo1-like protein [Kofleriaceae bacterium]